MMVRLSVFILIPILFFFDLYKPKEAMVTIQVFDENNRPIQGAEVGVDFLKAKGPGEGAGLNTEQKSGITDKNGFCTLAGNCTGSIGVGAKKEGYYSGTAHTIYFDDFKSGKWQPWNKLVKINLLKIGITDPMYAKRLSNVYPLLEIPKLNEPIGFDLMKSDWVEPYGKGNIADFIFKLKSNYIDDNNYDITLSMTFSNESDGIQSFYAPKVTDSQLRLPRLAPEEGYAPKLIQINSRKPGVYNFEAVFKEDQNYIFRVRTKIQDGKIISCHYGKIHGNIEFWDNKKIYFNYYLNSVPNSRSLEYDDKKNLFEDLSVLERPNAP